MWLVPLHYSGDLYLWVVDRGGLNRHYSLHRCRSSSSSWKAKIEALHRYQLHCYGRSLDAVKTAGKTAVIYHRHSVIALKPWDV
jgi:hypothetical protein